MTKPSRSESNGREAEAGASFRVDSAVRLQKPPIISRVISVSTPTHRATSISPRRSMPMASPMAVLPPAQAVETVSAWRASKWCANACISVTWLYRGISSRAPSSSRCARMSSGVLSSKPWTPASVAASAARARIGSIWSSKPPAATTARRPGGTSRWSAPAWASASRAAETAKVIGRPLTG